jgi:hypothetical protein
MTNLREKKCQTVRQRFAVGATVICTQVPISLGLIHRRAPIPTRKGHAGIVGCAYRPQKMYSSNLVVYGRCC